MSLTTGRGPLSGRPAGRFSSPVPAGLTYVEPFRRRVRGMLGGCQVVDSERVVLVHRSGEPPAYAFPQEDVRVVATEPEPALDGYVRVRWGDVGEWFEEGQQVFMHPRNPYHRIDCLPTERRLTVRVGGVLVVDTTETVAVFETSLDPRLYVGRRHTRPDVLTPSPTTTYCPYKGAASYWNAVVGGQVVEDVAWWRNQALLTAPIRAEPMATW